jgi:hypothetical protein
MIIKYDVIRHNPPFIYFKADSLEDALRLVTSGMGSRLVNETESLYRIKSEGNSLILMNDMIRGIDFEDEDLK